MHTKRSLSLFCLAFCFVFLCLPAVAQQVVAAVPVGNFPQGVAVNQTTNKIYVVNNCGGDPNCVSAGTVTEIDGGTFNTRTVTVQYYPDSVAVNPVTNQIYVG